MNALGFWCKNVKTKFVRSAQETKRDVLTIIART